jgi:endonuclease YncB( thermonuclease family)
MRNLIVCILLFVLPVSLFAKDTIPKGESREGKVVGVADGDTLTLLVDKTQYKIRLLGIDAPESAQPFGTQAKKALSEKVFGKEVNVTSNGEDSLLHSHARLTTPMEMVIVLRKQDIPTK